MKLVTEYEHTKSLPSKHGWQARCDTNARTDDTDTTVTSTHLDGHAAMAATLLQEYTWEIPQVHRRASRTVAPRQLRKTSKGLVAVMRSQNVLNSENAKEWLQQIDAAPPAPIASVWTEVDAWFVRRGHQFAVEGVRPLASLWGSAEELPPNLAVSLAMHGQLALPEQPVFAEEEEWRLYPLNFAPPTPTAAANQAGLHKSVPHWNKGWKIEYHGSSLYGISSAISVGEVFPSEPDTAAHRSACGRGAYSTGSLKMAARYAITHYFHDPLAPMHPWVVKMVLLIGIPSDGGDLPVAAWEQQDRSGLSKSEKKRTPAFKLTEDDDRLSKRQMRSEQGGRAREKDWTTEALDYSQSTSSRGYPLGICVGAMKPKVAKKYAQEGKVPMMTAKWHLEAELPWARPLR